VGLGYSLSDLGRGPFRPDQFRIPGVLQRIGIVYGIAATIALFFNWRLILISSIVLMAGYAALMLKFPYHGHTTGSLTEQDNLARSIDVAVFDRAVVDENGKTKWVQKHTYGPYPDNEGILSTIPSICTSLLGILAGLWLMSGRSPLEKCAGMLALSVPVTGLGWLLNWWLMPINKNLWSPSFVVFTAGLAMALLGFLFWMIDVRRRRRWALPFTIFGVNAIAAFALQTLLPHFMNMFRVNNPAGGDKVGSLQYLENGAVTGLHHLNTWVQAHMHWMPILDSPGNTSIVGSLAYIACVFVLLAILYAFKIFLKV
jgi:predicted acyltransferase